MDNQTAPTDQCAIKQIVTYAKLTIIWCRHHATVVAALGGALISAWLLRRPSNVVDDRLAVQLEAAQARTNVNALKAQQGAQAAHEHVAQTYADELQALNERQADAARDLENNPGALAAYLVRVAGGLDSQGRKPGS